MTLTDEDDIVDELYGLIDRVSSKDIEESRSCALTLVKSLRWLESDPPGLKTTHIRPHQITGSIIVAEYYDTIARLASKESPEGVFTAVIMHAMPPEEQDPEGYLLWEVRVVKNGLSPAEGVSDSLPWE